VSDHTHTKAPEAAPRRVSDESRKLLDAMQQYGVRLAIELQTVTLGMGERGEPTREVRLAQQSLDACLFWLREVGKPEVPGANLPPEVA
jgi:hypothetical protein